jgi:hypothetical protein
MIKIHENSKLLRVIYPFARLFGGVSRLRGGAFGRHIFLWGKVSDYEERVIWHETCHVCQYEKFGKFRYLLHHVGDWMTARFSGRSGYDSYHMIRWELQAYANESEMAIKAIYPEYRTLIESVKVYL